MAAAIASTSGAIGYVSISQVKSSHLQYALIRNRAGKYPNPSSATIAAAAASAMVGPGNAVPIVDSPTGYPISTFTYVIVRRSGKTTALRRFILFAVSARGQALGRPLDFAPLPSSVQGADTRLLASFTRTVP
jgi:phosphate transport system substrate-binding protein